MVDKESVWDIQAFIGNRTVKQTWNKWSVTTQSCSMQRWEAVPQNTRAGQRRMLRLFVSGESKVVGWTYNMPRWKRWDSLRRQMVWMCYTWCWRRTCTSRWAVMLNSYLTQGVDWNTMKTRWWCFIPHKTKKKNLRKGRGVFFFVFEI
jgi:hypothetical protein